MNFTFLFRLAVIIVLLSCSTVFSMPPSFINYQGRLTDSLGNPVPDSIYSVSFTLYDDPISTGPMYWQEQHSVSTKDGLFSVTLGTFDDLNYALLLNLPSMWNAYLGIKVGSDPEMSPRVRLTSTLFSQYANHSDNVGTVNQASGGIITSTLRVNDSLGVGLEYAPSEQLDVGGNVKISGKIAVQSNAGDTIKPAIGERWRDNSINAWCRVNYDGTLISSFGIDSVQHPSVGHYLIYLSNNYGSNTNNMVVVAQAYSTIENHILTSVYPLSASIVEVGLKLFNTNSLYDGGFVMLMTGR